MIDISQYSKEINKLDKLGILLDKVKGDEIFFNCLTNPYLPQPNDIARAILGQIGNVWTYHGSTKKLIVGRFGEWKRPAVAAQQMVSALESVVVSTAEEVAQSLQATGAAAAEQNKKQ